MRASEAIHRLASLVPPGTDARAAWSGFKTMARTAIRQPTEHRDGKDVFVAHDELLFETAFTTRRAIRHRDSPPARMADPDAAFMLHFSRELALRDADDEYRGYYGVTLTCEFELAPVLRGLVWITIDGAGPTPGAAPEIDDDDTRVPLPLERWIEAVESSEPFVAAVLAQEAVDIYYEEGTDY